MLKHGLILLLLFFQLELRAQHHLYFFNKQENKMIEVIPGQTLALLYSGYMGQTEFAKNVVTEITDSTVVLGHHPDRMSPWFKQRAEKKTLKNGAAYKVVRIKDIKGFRRITNGRQVLKTLTQTASIVGLFYLAGSVYRSPDISTGNAFLISFASGIGTSVIINVLFPENIKYHVGNTWQVISATNAPKQ